MGDGRTRRRVRGTGLVSLVAVGTLAGAASGQELADYDYENLSFRGVGVEAGVAFPSRLETTTSIHFRVDLGFLGPGFRLAPQLSYWSTDFKSEEIGELEDRVEELVELTEPGATPTVDLGPLTWSDFVIGLDGEYVWFPGPTFEAFIGSGFAAHVMNGEGSAIRDTFVEDLLDRVTIGVNGHFGVAMLMARGLRLTGQVRYEFLDDLSYPELRFGAMWAFNAGPDG